MGTEQGALPGCEAAVGSEAQAKPKSEAKAGKPRYEAIEREQLCWRPIDIERLIAADHPARAVWEFVGGLDLSSYQEQARAVEGKAGRPGWDPRLLVSVWVYAYSKGVGSARAIEELCQWDPAYQWLTGSQVINAHTLSDFRVKHDGALKGLFAQSLGLLSAAGLITLERVMQDGTKIRAKAAADSFRRQERIEQALQAAQAQVAAVEAMSEEEGSRRMAKARERAARQRQERLEQALKEFEQLEKDGKDKESRRVSTSDCEARVMKQPGGGYAPSYNVQIDTDAKNCVVVAVGVVQAGNDFEQLGPGIDRVEQNQGKVPETVVTDGGYVSKNTIVGMQERKIEYLAPCVDEAGKGQSSYDSRGVSEAYHSSKFSYDAQSNSYLCPQGKRLSYEGKEQRHLQVS